MIVVMEEAHEILVVVDGTKIAKRRRPNTPWVSLEPGWAVRDGTDDSALVVEYDGVEVD